jgi:hypothetical protein
VPPQVPWLFPKCRGMEKKSIATAKDVAVPGSPSTGARTEITRMRMQLTRPLYPVNALDENNQFSACMDQKEDEGSDSPLPPYPDVPVEDIVSHVESLPHVNEAAYTSVRFILL